MFRVASNHNLKGYFYLQSRCPAPELYVRAAKASKKKKPEETKTTTPVAPEATPSAPEEKTPSDSDSDESDSSSDGEDQEAEKKAQQPSQASASTTPEYKAFPELDVSECGRKMFTPLIREGMVKSRFVFRCVPVQCVCHSDLASITQAVGVLLAPHMPKPAMTPIRVFLCDCSCAYLICCVYSTCLKSRL